MRRRGCPQRPAAARGWLALLPAVFLLVLPTCPLCLIAYGGLFGAAGLSFFEPVYRVGLLPLTSAALALAVGAVVWLGREGAGLWAGGLASVGAVLVLAGKFWLSSMPVTVGGLLLMLVIIVGLTVSRGRRGRLPEQELVPKP